ncbi:MAG: hypothetical protein ABFS86_06280 [Planctomycetota bacterium]
MESDFKELWNAGNGDLIYGDSGTRMAYFSGAGMSIPQGKFAYMDDFNNNFFCPILGTLNPLQKKQTIDKLVEAVEDAALKSGVGNYIRGIWNHKYSPKNALSLNPVVLLEKEGYISVVKAYQKLIREDPTRAKMHRGNLWAVVKKAYESKAIRRGCKYGLLMIIHGLNESFPNARIHFALDGLRLGQIARRETYTAKVGGHEFQRFSITGTELRSLCRQWQSIKLSSEKMSRLVFYVNGGVVGPPWLDSWNKTDVNGGTCVNDAKDWRPYLQKHTPQVRDENLFRELTHVEPPPVPSRANRPAPPTFPTAPQQPETHAQKFARIRDRFESGQAFRS